MASQQGASHPYVGVLTSPPFFTVPGINPASPISTQAEQLDQMNTLLLQTIDANFARVHQIITTRILPEIKRFAIASEPTRRSAEFWHHFYTSAAAVDLTAPGLGYDATESEVTMSMSSLAPNDSYRDQSTSIEGSFASVFDPPPGPGVSSTPLPNRRDPAWDPSEIDSPYSRVDRDLAHSLRLDRSADDNSSLTTPSVMSAYHPPGAKYDYDASTGTVEAADLPFLAKREESASTKEETRPPVPNVFAPSEASSSHASVNAAFEAYAQPTPRHYTAARNELSHSTMSTMSFGRFTATVPDFDGDLEPSRASSTTLQRSTASRLLESTRSTASHRDDAVDAGETPRVARPRPETHLIDLTNTPLNIAKFTQNLGNNNTTHSRPSAPSGPSRTRNLLEDSEDDMGKLGFSPPVTMQFNLPPRASAIYAEARETKKPAEGEGDEAKTQKVLNDLLADMTASFSPSPVMPAEFRRYSIMPSDLGHGRRLFGSPAEDSGSGGKSKNIFAPPPEQRASGSNLFAPQAHPKAQGYDPDSPFNPDTYAYPPAGRPRRSVAHTSFGSDMQTAVDSSGRDLDDDDLDDDDDMDSFDDTIQDGAAAHEAAVAAAGAGFSFEEDSYMSDDESYLATRHRKEFTDTNVVGAREDTSEVFGRPSGGRGQFALHQQDEMLTYHGGRLEDARVPGTPLGGGDADISSLGQRR